MAKGVLEKLQKHYARYNTLDQMIVGLDYIEQKLYTDALNIFDKLVLESTDMGTIYKNALKNKGFCLYMLGKFPEALDCYDKLLAIEPNRNRWGCRACCLYEMGKYLAALESCNKGLALNDTDPASLLTKADCLSKLGKYEEAIEYYDKYSMIELSASTLRAKAFCLIRTKRYDEAIDVIDSALKLAPKNLNTLYQKILCLCKLGEYEKALTCSDEVAVLDSGEQNQQKVLNYKILALRALARHDGANACQKVLDALPMRGFIDEDALLHKASTLNRLGSS